MNIRWGVLFRSDCKLDGKREHLMFENNLPALFVTRKQAREWITKNYGYIRTRPDLRAEPHGWKIPIPVRVKIEVIE